VVITPVSPNTVLANALNRVEDILAPRIRMFRPDRVTFVVGTQINGAPHLGTSLVQSLAFGWAARVRERFGLPTTVHFSALDNAPFEVTAATGTGIAYQRAYAQALGEPAIDGLVRALYRPLFDTLSDRLGVPYTVETYTEQQATEEFRSTWLDLQPRLDLARFHLAPSTGTPHVRVPCPDCGWADKFAIRTTVHPTPTRAIVQADCLNHGPYAVEITPDGGGYLDLATLYRNLVKETILAADPRTLQVMVKGGDWTFGSALVDGAMLALGLAERQLPARLFCPQVITDTGAKLSKSLIRDGRGTLPEGAAPWMLDTREWPGTTAEYADSLLALAEVLLSDPRHHFRSYSAAEIGRLMPAASARSVPAP
jgi:hypothetical protein